MRELLRKRLTLVRQQTMSVLGIQGMVTRYENIQFTADKIKRYKDDEAKILQPIKEEHVRLTIQSQLKILSGLMEQINTLEKAILAEIKEDTAFKLVKKCLGLGQF